MERDQSRAVALSASAVPRWVLTVPAALFLLVAFVVPFATFVAYAFLHGGYFEVSGGLTLENFRDALANSVARTLTLTAFAVGAATAVIATALGVPIAFALRFRVGRLEYPLLSIIVFTMFASYLARIYAWRAILGEDGVVHAVADALGTGRPELLFTKTAVILALVHIYLPFVILVVYAALRNLPKDLLDLSSDLGASPARRFVSVVLPLCATSVASAFLYVFVLSAADYVTPQFLGGRKAQMVGVLIQSEFTQQGNYPGGAAMALLLLLSFAAVYLVVATALRLFGVSRIAVRAA